MLQQDKADDFVIATGETHSVREFTQKVFSKLDLDYKKYVFIDPRYFRPYGSRCIAGRCIQSKNTLNWSPKLTLDGLIDMMIENDLELDTKRKNSC